MQRSMPLAIVVLLAGCGTRPAETPAFPEAPTLVDADPMRRDAPDDHTLLVSENLVAPPQLYAELTQPPSDAPVAGGPAIGPEPPIAAPDPLAALSGEYRYSGGRKGVGRAIDAVVDRMGAFARPIARKRLAASNKVPYSVTIGHEGDEVTVRLDGRAYVAKLGGGSRRVSGVDGTPSRLRYRMRDGALYQVFEASEGTRTNVFHARDDGGIDMTVRISSERLPSDIRYRISFKAE